MILLGLGGNLPSAQFGAPRATLEAALGALVDAGVGVPRRSRWYRSAPVPDNGQPALRQRRRASSRPRCRPPICSRCCSRSSAASGGLARSAGRRASLDLDLLAYHEHANWSARAGGAADRAASPAPRARLRAGPLGRDRPGLASPGARPDRRGAAGRAAPRAICRSARWSRGGNRERSGCGRADLR